MASIYYQINSGYPNFTAHIEPNVAGDQIHSSIGIYSFDNIPEGDYSVTITDAIGCEAFFDNINITSTTTTTTTTTIYTCDYNGTLTVGVDDVDYGYIKDFIGSLIPSPTIYDVEITGIYYEEGYIFVDVSSQELIVESIQIGANSYIITDGVSELTDNPFTEGLDYNICIMASPCTPEVYVCGSGELEANMGYCHIGESNGKARYLNGIYTIFWYVQSDIECWVMRRGDSEYLYFSEEDVLTPDLVVEWHVGVFGTLFPRTAIGELPLPIVFTIPCPTTTTTTTTSTTSTTTSTTTTTTTTPPVEEVNYGVLYNWYAANDGRNIANTGWHVPTVFEYQTLADYLGAGGDYSSNSVGGKLKETGLTYWDAPNTGATNEVGFNARGGGYRSASQFADLKNTLILWTSTVWFAGTGVTAVCFTNSTEFDCIAPIGQSRYFGYSLRLIKDSTTLTDGQTGTYTGNNGRVYNTICIGTQEWVAENIAETKYNNGDIITEVTDQSTWAALITEGLCAYNNDWSNV